jgi:hypothetical protein
VKKKKEKDKKSSTLTKLKYPKGILIGEKRPHKRLITRG